MEYARAGLNSERSRASHVIRGLQQLQKTTMVRTSRGYFAGTAAKGDGPVGHWQSTEEGRVHTARHWPPTRASLTAVVRFSRDLKMFVVQSFNASLTREQKCLTDFFRLLPASAFTQESRDALFSFWIKFVASEQSLEFQIPIAGGPSPRQIAPRARSIERSTSSKKEGRPSKHASISVHLINFHRSSHIAFSGFSLLQDCSRAVRCYALPFPWWLAAAKRIEIHRTAPLQTNRNERCTRPSRPKKDATHDAVRSSSSATLQAWTTSAGACRAALLLRTASWRSR